MNEVEISIARDVRTNLRIPIREVNIRQATYVVTA